jgi:hypothetical protein
MNKVWICLFFLFFGIIVGYQSCGSGEGFKALSIASKAPRVFDTDLSSVPATDFSEAVTALAKTLVNRLPTQVEIQTASTGVIGYKSVVDQYLADPSFATSMFEEHQSYFGMGGTRTGSTVVFDGPALLGSYLIANNGDYREIVTADYCVRRVDGVLQKTACDNFPDPATAQNNAAGVLTDRAFIVTHKPKKGFNFRIVKELFAKFQCSVYPDPQDPSMSAVEISSSMHPFGRVDGKVTECFACHRAVNPKAVLFFKYTKDGSYSENISNTTFRDTNEIATPDDLLVPGVNPRVMNQTMNSVRDLGQLMASNDKFANCMATRYYNFLLGKKMGSPVHYGIDELGSDFKRYDYNVKKLIRRIVISQIYLNKGNLPRSLAEALK